MKSYVYDRDLEKGEIVLSIILSIIYALGAIFGILLMANVFGPLIPTLLGDNEDVGVTTYIFGFGILTMVPTILMYFSVSNFNMPTWARRLLFVGGFLGVVIIGVFYTQQVLQNSSYLGETFNTVLYVSAPWVALLSYSLVLFLSSREIFFKGYKAKFFISLAVLTLSTLLAFLFAIALFILLLWLIYKIVMYFVRNSDTSSSSSNSSSEDKKEEIIVYVTDEYGHKCELKRFGYVLRPLREPYTQIFSISGAPAYQDDLRRYWIEIDGKFIRVNEHGETDVVIFR